MSDDIEDFKNEMETRRIARLRRDWELTRQKSEELLAAPIPRYRRPKPPVIEENETEARQRERERISVELDQQFPDHDDAWTQWEKNMPKPQITEKERRERALNNDPITAAVLNVSLAKSADHLRAEFIAMLDERDHIRREALCEALAELLGQERDEAADRLSDETKALRLELTTLQEALAEMRTVVDHLKTLANADKARVIEMPAPPLRRAN